ncbi:FNIP repeat-containing protein [Cotonvirus japonicus]|uniref:FNIP repeat-containing protein n=1 Tax=Cotonvirus japonicus TaxID=2811091 RepID=A0ABM7NS92_9VIRU|nr:FNIP repeat-containing protein [Cotonvirus japonicus]BCS82967.1 FNIP repeat-containing protein [Cotonvirus japonicus]
MSLNILEVLDSFILNIIIKFLDDKSKISFLSCNKFTINLINDDYMTFKLNNVYNYEEIKSSRFIKNFSNVSYYCKGSYNIPDCTTHLFFLCKLNQPLNKYSLNNVKEISLPGSFNQLIYCLPKNLKTIYFGNKFNQSIENCFHDGIETIYFGREFNQSIENHLPKTLKDICFGDNFNQSIKNSFFNGLEILCFGDNFNQPIENYLPNSLKCLYFGDNFNQPIKNYLPNNLTDLKLGKNFTYSLEGCIPSKLQSLTIKNINPIDISNCVIEQEKSLLLNKNGVPDSLVNFSIGCQFNEKYYYIPDTVQCLKIANPCNFIPKNVTNLKFGYGFHGRIKNLPITVKKLQCKTTNLNIDDDILKQLDYLILENYYYYEEDDFFNIKRKFSIYPNLIVKIDEKIFC